jgi:hypothetical protein
MGDEAEPHAIAELADLASYTLENFCFALSDKTQKDRINVDSSHALIELMGLALYWVWVFDHLVDLEDVLKAVQSKAEAWIEADPDEVALTVGDAQKIDPPRGRLH